jgi:putative SOS response-associated peptidase YedK
VIEREGVFKHIFRQPPSAEQCSKDFEPWLSGEAGIELLKPAPDDLLQRWPVSKRVNSSKTPGDDPTLIDQVVA